MKTNWLCRGASRLLVSSLVLVLLTGCGTDNNSSATPVPVISCASGAISGAGSTFVQTLVQQWIAQYTRACPGTSLDYKGIGSSGGIQQFTAGTVDFAGSDVPLKPQELAAAEAKRGQVLQLPWGAGAIAVMYKIDGVPNLQLSGRTLAGIFAGTIKRWNDPQVMADNPGAKLPSLAVQPVHRSDGSGTTAAFTAYLAAIAPEVWTYGASKDVQWPTGQGAKGSDGVTGLVKSAEGTVAYAEVSYAQLNALGIAKIRNATGAYVAPDAHSVTAALSEAKVKVDLNSNLTVTLNYQAESPAAYPIATVTYVIFPKKESNATKLNLEKSFISYALNDGQLEAERLFYAPLPEQMVNAGTEALNK